MQIEIDDVLMDKLIVDTLKRDYISQQNDIDRLLSKAELRDFEREDLWMHKETAEGIAIVLRSICTVLMLMHLLKSILYEP